MKTAVIPQVRVEAELRAQLEAALGQNETLSDFVKEAVRHAVERRRVERAFHARGQAALEAYRHTGEAIPAEQVLAKLQARLDDKRRQMSAP